MIDFAEKVDVPAVIAGSGPLLQQLQRRANDAKVPVIVIERPSDQLLRAVMQLAAAFIYPPIEDFGIMPVEAYALGTPALVNEVGGAKEAAEVTGGGAVIDFSAPETWSEAFDAVTRRDSSFARDAHLAFSHERFASEFHQWLDGRD